MRWQTKYLKRKTAQGQKYTLVQFDASYHEGDYLSSEDVKSFMDEIQKSLYPVEVLLRRQWLRHEDFVDLLILLLGKNSPLISLDLSGSNVQDEDIFNTKNIQKITCRNITLFLNYTQVTAKGILELFKKHALFYRTNNAPELELTFHLEGLGLKDSDIKYFYTELFFWDSEFITINVSDNLLTGRAIEILRPIIELPWIFKIINHSILGLYPEEYHHYVQNVPSYIYDNNVFGQPRYINGQFNKSLTLPVGYLVAWERFKQLFSYVNADKLLDVFQTLLDSGIVDDLEAKRERSIGSCSSSEDFIDKDWFWDMEIDSHIQPLNDFFDLYISPDEECIFRNPMGLYKLYKIMGKGMRKEYLTVLCTRWNLSGDLNEFHFKNHVIENFLKYTKYKAYGLLEAIVLKNETYFRRLFYSFSAGVQTKVFESHFNTCLYNLRIFCDMNTNHKASIKIISPFKEAIESSKPKLLQNTPKELVTENPYILRYTFFTQLSLEEKTEHRLKLLKIKNCALISRNIALLMQGYRDDENLLSMLSREMLVLIVSMTGDEDIHTQEEAYSIAYERFTHTPSVTFSKN